MKTRTAIFPIVALCIAMVACASPPINDETMDNFTLNGFINDDCFQKVISEMPDREENGLVEQRESAFLKGKTKCADTIVLELIEYICARNTVTAEKAGLPDDPAVSPAPDRRKIESQVRGYLQYGYIAEEFYREDNSVVLVYRLRKKGLKKEIDSIRCN